MPPNWVELTHRVIVSTSQFILMASEAALEVANTVVEQAVHVVTLNSLPLTFDDSVPF